MCSSDLYGQVTLIVMQARELGITVPFIGGDGWEAPELLKGPGAARALEGCYFSTHYSADQDIPKSKEFVAKYTEMSIASFIQDVEIWNNKVRVGNPVLCDGDGPINMVRKWYSQFYMDAADVPPELVKRKTHVTL